MTENFEGRPLKWKGEAQKLFEKIKKAIQSFTWPALDQWKKALTVFPRSEKITLLLIFLAACGSLAALGYEFYLTHTKIVAAEGGRYTEALIGQPRFLNPVLAAVNDADRDITELVFSGLMKYGPQGELVPDLAERYEILNDGKVYEFFLKKDVRWHDGQQLNAEDVIFTIKTIQNSDYKSPVRSNWTGVQIEKIHDFGVRFTLRSQYPPFLENTVQKIIPEHIWRNIHAGAFSLAYANLEPVGTGPFRFQALESDSSGTVRSVALLRSENYYGAKPHLKEITFYFFRSEKEALEAFKRNDVRGMQFLSADNLDAVLKKEGVRVARLTLPRTFTVFLNQTQSEILKDKRVREALLLASDKEAVLSGAFGGQGVIIHSPFIPGFFAQETQLPTTTYDREASNELLEKAGWVYKSTIDNRQLTINQTGSGKTEQIEEEQNYRVRIKVETRKEGRKTIKEEIEVPLKIKLVTAESPELAKTAELLKEQWEKAGFKVEIAALPSKELQEDWIKPRAYEALLFGQVFRKDPDPFVFWHSSQKEDPGLNLSLYENTAADKLLEEARQSPDETARKEKYAQFAQKISEDIPAIFLVSPTYFYPVSSEIQGVNAQFIVDPSQRFSSIGEWYIKTKRAWR